jgi:hypothetical protein
MWRTVFSHKDIVKLSYEFVALVGHGNPDHGEADYNVGGKKTHLCNVYNLPSCKSHEDMRTTLTQKNLLPDVRGTPTHILYNPHDMKEISRSHSQTVGSMTDSIVAAQKVLGKPITYKAFSKLTKNLDEAEAFIAEEDFRKAMKAMKGFDAKGLESLVARAAELQAKIDGAAEARLGEARKLIDEGENGKALKLLRNVLRDFSGTDYADKAKELIVVAKEAE